MKTKARVSASHCLSKKHQDPRKENTDNGSRLRILCSSVTVLLNAIHDFPITWISFLAQSIAETVFFLFIFTHERRLYLHFETQGGTRLLPPLRLLSKVELKTHFLIFYVKTLMPFEERERERVTNSLVFRK